MCGRFTLTNSAEVLAEAFDLEDLAELAPRYNIAPTQDILAIRVDGSGRRVGVELKWGLIPSWTKDLSKARPLINARSETVASKPSFKRAFAKRRCLVPASGFFEWQGEPGHKQPFLIRRHAGAGGVVPPLAIAGIFETWHGKGGEVVDSASLLTTEANALVRPIHDRMPVILGPRDFDLWLDPAQHDPEAVEPLLVPCPPDWLEAIAVNPRVNNARHDDPQCIEPLDAG